MTVLSRINLITNQKNKKNSTLHFGPSYEDSNMTPSETEELRRILVNKRLRLANDIAYLQNEALEKTNDDNKENIDNHKSEEIQDQSLTFGSIDNKRSIIRMIDQALERMGNGTYGICQSTNKQIPKSILRSMPWAKYCYRE